MKNLIYLNCITSFSRIPGLGYYIMYVMNTSGWVANVAMEIWFGRNIVLNGSTEEIRTLKLCRK